MIFSQFSKFDATTSYEDIIGEAGNHGIGNFFTWNIINQSYFVGVDNRDIIEVAGPNCSGFVVGFHAIKTDIDKNPLERVKFNKSKYN